MNPQLSTQSKLKTILEKDDTQKGVTQFESILLSSKKHNENDINILLRWTIMNQKKYFSDYLTILKKFGVDVNFADTREKKTNLMIACELKKQEIVEVLLGVQECDCLLENIRNKNALFYAIANKSRQSGERFVRLLVRKCPQLVKKAYRLNNPLYESLINHKVQIIRALLQQGMNPNSPIDINSNTALHETIKLVKKQKNKATVNSLKQILQILIENGADPAYKVLPENKSALDISEKYQEQLIAMYEQAKRKKDKPEEAIQTTKKSASVYIQPIVKTALHSSASPKKQKFQPLHETDEDDEGFDDDPFEPANDFIGKLTKQIQDYQRLCEVEHIQADKDVQQFIKVLTPIAMQIGFTIQVIGSYATGLWLYNCDINLLLVPIRQHLNSTFENRMQYIAKKLQNTIYQKLIIICTTKIPIIKIQLGDDRDCSHRFRKFDITIFNPSNTGLQHVSYIKQLIQVYPQIKPLFLILKKLTYSYKLHDALKAGVRSFALFLMLVIFIQQQTVMSLGQLLLRFLYKYGYACQYDYQDNGKVMVLILPDPINGKNNVGKNTDVFTLQRMFKTSYIILHTRQSNNRLKYIFQANQMFP